MSEATEALLVRIDATTEVLRRELKRADAALNSSATKADRSMAAFQKSFAKADRAVARTTRSLGGLKTIVGALGVGKIVSETIRAADGYASLQGQLKLVTDSQEELNSVYDRSLALANKTGQSTEATVKLYARLARSSEELNLTQNELFTITEAVNQSFVVSGASAQESAAATLQLSQGLASGVLRGEELNSVMENSPRLARALADGLGVGIGQLRELGSAGELTAERVTSALLRTSSDIEAEFNDMPMTISRVMQTLANDTNHALGQVDTGPLIGAVEELRDVISDPATSEAITTVAGALLSLATGAAKALTAVTGVTKFIAEDMAAAFGEIAADDIPRLEDALERAQRELEYYSSLGSGAGDATKGLRDEVDKLTKKLEVARVFSQGLTKSTKNTTAELKREGDVAGSAAGEIESLIKPTKEAIEQQKEWEKRLRATSDAFSDSYDELDRMTRGVEDHISQLEFELSLFGQSERAQAILVAVREKGAYATEEQRARLEALTGAIFDENEALQQSEDRLKAATQELDPFTQAIVHAAERIDSAFADAWKGAFDSFDDFRGGITDAFKQLIGELLHQIFTANIGKSLFASLGIGSAGASASSGGGLSGLFTGGGGSGGSGIGDLLSTGSSLYSTFSGGIGAGFSGLGSSLYGGLSSLGAGGGALANSLYNTGNSIATNFLGQGTQTVGAGTAIGGLATAGAGAVGGYLGGELASQFTDKTANSSWGATAGSAIGAYAAAGSIGGPWGAAIGAAVGAAIDVFGGSSKIENNGARTELDLSTGQRFSTGRQPGDKKFSEENFNSVEAAADAMQQFSALIGGSAASFDIHQGNRRGIRLNGEEFNSMADAVSRGFQRIIGQATNLDPALRKLVRGFDGTIDQTLEWTSATASMLELVKTNPVDNALQDIATAQSAASVTLTSAYLSSQSTFSDLLSQFDGTAEGASNLNDHLMRQKALAYELAASLQSVSSVISTSFPDLAKYFRDSILSEDELRKQQLAERQSIRDSISTLFDPEELNQAQQRYNELSRTIFDGFDEGTQAYQAQFFAGGAEAVAGEFQRQIAISLDNVREREEEANFKTSEVLRSAASDFQKPVDDFGAYVRQLVTGGIEIRISSDGRTAEVVQ